MAPIAAELQSAGPFTVLVVEDSNPAYDAVRATLRLGFQWAGFKVMEAGSVADAVRILSDSNGLVDAAIADHAPNSLDAFELLELIRNSGQNLPIVIILPKSYKMTIPTPARASIVHKPVYMDVLVRRTCEMLPGR